MVKSEFLSRYGRHNEAVISVSPACVLEKSLEQPYLLIISMINPPCDIKSCRLGLPSLILSRLTPIPSLRPSPASLVFHAMISPVMVNVFNCITEPIKSGRPHHR